MASEDESLVLCSDGNLWVDVDAFDEVANTARRSRDPVTHRAAIALYAGELLLDNRYQAWAEGGREELWRLYLARWDQQREKRED